MICRVSLDVNFSSPSVRADSRFSHGWKYTHLQVLRITILLLLCTDWWVIIIIIIIIIIVIIIIIIIIIIIVK